MTEEPASGGWVADARRLTGRERVVDLVEDHPELGVVLQSYGVCACCSGGSTLDASARLRGLSLDDLLEELRRVLGSVP